MTMGPSTSYATSYSSPNSPKRTRSPTMLALAYHLAVDMTSTLHVEQENESSNPIQKTISFLRNKMDGSNSSIAHPSKEEVNKWKSSFDALVQNKYGNQLFRQFLNKEMSSENLDFWEHCEEFRNKWKDDKKSMTKKANEIYQKFITEQAPNQVNLDCATREATKAALYSGCEKDTFSLAQNIIEKLMETDSYKRFLKDPIYLDVLRSFDVENTNPQKH